MALRMGAIGTLYMRLYVVPPDMNEKEKVIGGLLNINQFFWLIGGVALGASVFFATMRFLGTVIATIIAVFFCLAGIPFAVCKIKGLTLFQYLKYKHSYKKKTKKMPNLRKDMTLDGYIRSKFLK